MIKLSVNINKVATIRNARGGNLPNLIQVAIDCERFGAQGITVHPRPDERHIRYKDVYQLKSILTTEFNIEGYPSERFIDLVLDVKPAQVTLVPDPPDAITSNVGWKVKENLDFLRNIIDRFKHAGIRTSIFTDPCPHVVEEAMKTGTDRIELYTESYAKIFPSDPAQAIAPYAESALKAEELNIGINAGHDLNLENLHYFAEGISGLLEVSIGHALICDSLYYGLENTIQRYLNCLNPEKEVSK